MGAIKRNVRRHHLQRLAQEIHNVSACLSTCRAAIAKQVGLSVEQWRALTAIDRSTFVMSISDLARKLRHARQSTQSLARGLERAGWIQFLPNRDDRRLLQMQLTASGKSILSTAEESFNAWLLTMAYDLSERDLSELTRILGALRERIGKARDFA